MLKIYCAECGNPTSYSSVKPKFCSNCGNSFEKILVNKVLNQKPTITKIKSNISRAIEENDIEEDGDEVNRVPNISEIDCEIINDKSSGEKIGSLIGTFSGNPREKNHREKTKKVTKADLKKFKEDFAKEAGALRPKSRGGKNG